MSRRFPADSKLAIIGLTATEVAIAFNGCSTELLIVGLAGISGLGGFTLGVANGGQQQSSKND